MTQPLNFGGWLSSNGIAVIPGNDYEFPDLYLEGTTTFFTYTDQPAGEFRFARLVPDPGGTVGDSQFEDFFVHTKTTAGLDSFVMEGPFKGTLRITYVNTGTENARAAIDVVPT